MMLVKSMIPELQERELHGIFNFPNSVAPTFPFYDGKEHNSRGTGAKAPEDFSDSVAADISDYDAGEQRDP
jgi:hypothetical protein